MNNEPDPWAPLSEPILGFREQLLYRLACLAAVLDAGKDPLDVANAMYGVRVESFQNAGRERWYASWEYAHVGVVGDTPDEAKRNLVLRLRRYNPDERREKEEGWPSFGLELPMS